MFLLTRRRLLAGAALAGGCFLMPRRAGAVAQLPAVRVYRQPGCSCCEVWAARMVAAGFSVAMADDPDLDGRRRQLGIPDDLASCHVALIGGSVFEGHVPPADIKRFLAEAPPALGLAVPGMPVGSPGMDLGGQSEAYDVVMFGRDGARQVYARY